ncbi:uncharacterized protein LOC105437513 isoform X2 [Strongylocentrotus purpuratus]|uniref:Uncharacterized protein n=1 Tax=Strongylocentrotus purpuratus TaxID=7668 RepID=A0A7M7LSK7_STRPU|nr:uncharacterized protein LOC105437513 isoform X2 [Strongylocentrotus purpuratus]|eukprot:XP_011662484.1 PREDICTED: uncharacterized protein LOC105437513 [Strongylocentrotus purpuratus]
MKVQSGISLCALAIVTLALVAEATYDLQRLLDLDEDQYYKRGDTDLDPDWEDEWEDLPFKRGVGTQKFIACFHPGLQTKCFCDRTKPKYSRKYFYYCRGARRQLRPV